MMKIALVLETNRLAALSLASHTFAQRPVRPDFIIWLLKTVQICQKIIEIAKVGSVLCQTLKKPSKVCLRFLKVYLSGEI